MEFRKKCGTLKLVVLGALGMVKKGKVKHINEILTSPGLYEMQKMLTTELLISLG